MLNKMELIKRMIGNGKVTKDILPEFSKVFACELLQYVPLTDNDIKAICYHWRLDHDKICSEIAIQARCEEFSTEEAQRVAFALEVAEIESMGAREAAAILVDPAILSSVAVSARVMWKKHREWEKEYPGTEAWLKEIDGELEWYRLEQQKFDSVPF